MGHSKAVHDVTFDNSGGQFLSAAFDRQMKLWDTETGASRFFSCIVRVALRPRGRGRLELVEESARKVLTFPSSPSFFLVRRSVQAGLLERQDSVLHQVPPGAAVDVPRRHERQEGRPGASSGFSSLGSSVLGARA